MDGSILEFDGHLKVTGDKSKDKILPNFTKGEKLTSDLVEKNRKKKLQPPARFNEASLIKALEANGIGRPSTLCEYH